MVWNPNPPGTGFTRLNGGWLDAPADVNIFPVGTASIQLKGSYTGVNTPSTVTSWKIKNAHGQVIATGGPITTGTFTVPVTDNFGRPLRTRPGWFHVYLYNASGVYMGGGMFILEPVSSPWPTGDFDYYGARLAIPGGRMTIINPSDPGASNFAGSWADPEPASLANSADFTAAHLADSTPWDTADPERKAKRIRLVNFPNYNDSTPHRTGATHTAERYVGKGFSYECINEPSHVNTVGGGVPDAAYVPTVVGFARAIWAGDSSALVYLPCPVGFTRTSTSKLDAFFTALRAAVTDPEWAKFAISFHDYNVGFSNLQALDECWTPFLALLAAHGLDTRPRCITEMDAMEVAHYGAGDFGRALARFSTTFLLAQCHVERERIFVFYLRQHGGDYNSWIMAEGGQPYAQVAWLMTLERETRRALFVERHDAGADVKHVLSLRFARTDGTGTVVAKSAGRGESPVTYALSTSGGASMPTTITVVDYEGVTSTVPVVAGQFNYTLTPYPVHFRAPANVTITLVPTVRPKWAGGVSFISSIGGLGAAPSPVNSLTSRESLIWDVGVPGGDVKFAWQGAVPFTDGQWVGVASSDPFVLQAVGISTPFPRQTVSTIVNAEVQVRVGGSWVPALLEGAPVVIDEDLPYEIATTTAQDGVTGWYLGYDPGNHAWVLPVTPVTCTGWRVVVHQVTYGESPTRETFRSAPGSGASGAFAPFNGFDSDDHAGFGNETPYLHVSGLDTYGHDATGGGGGGGGGGAGTYYLVSA